jgi:hypothetical protein
VGGASLLAGIASVESALSRSCFAAWRQATRETIVAESRTAVVAFVDVASRLASRLASARLNAGEALASRLVSRLARRETRGNLSFVGHRALYWWVPLAGESGTGWCRR